MQKENSISMKFEVMPTIQKKLVKEVKGVNNSWVPNSKLTSSSH